MLDLRAVAATVVFIPSVNNSNLVLSYILARTDRSMGHVHGGEAWQRHCGKSKLPTQIQFRISCRKYPTNRCVWRVKCGNRAVWGSTSRLLRGRGPRLDAG